ncbi:MAG: hypothetical protein LBQ86_06075 [Holophagales bacterium]|jgi:DnaJ-domain-containing protein 1|nr:hypothetical protein [Holophagales bacterium]
MRGLLIAIATAAMALLPNNPLTAQGSMSTQWRNLSASWETSLEAGDGKKVRQEAEDILKRYDQQISSSNYNELHAKVAILGIAARGAVLDGDWPGAVSLLLQASTTAQQNHAYTSETLGSLRAQHEAKISEWKESIKPQDEQLRWLKSLDGLRSDQIKQYGEIETFLAEHNNAIANSEQAIKDIDGILSLLRLEEETCARSLTEWNGFLSKERLDIQGLGSQKRYVTEKLAQVKGDANRPRFERIAYARRLLRLDPTNGDCQGFLNSVLGIKAPQSPRPPATKKKR